MSSQLSVLNLIYYSNFVCVYVSSLTMRFESYYCISNVHIYYFYLPVG